MCVQAEASTGCVRVRFSKPGNNTHTEQAPSSPQCSLRHFICCEPNELTSSPPYSPTGWPARTLRGPLYTVTPSWEATTWQLGYLKPKAPGYLEPKAPAQTEPKVKTRTYHVLSDSVRVFRLYPPATSGTSQKTCVCSEMRMVTASLSNDGLHHRPVTVPSGWFGMSSMCCVRMKPEAGAP